MLINFAPRPSQFCAACLSQAFLQLPFSYVLCIYNIMFAIFEAHHNLSFQKGILRMQINQDIPPYFCAAY